MEYVRSVKNNPIAKAVKIADLFHNSDISRLEKVTEKDELRLKLYWQALNFLQTPE